MTDQYPSPGFQPPSPFGSEPTGPQPPSFQPAGAVSSSGGSAPRRTTIAAIVLAVLLVVVAVGAGILISGARSDADDAEAELAKVKQSLDSSLSGSGSVEGQIDEMVKQQDSDARDKAELSATIDDQSSQIADLTSQIDSMGDVATVQAALDQANAELDQTTAELDQTKAAFEQGQSDLADANAALAAAQSQSAAAAFTVEPASIKPILGDFSVTTNKVACDGFADPVSACPDTIPLSGRFIEDGTQLFMEFADVAKVPIGTFDGFNYAGSTPATNEASSLCGGQVVPATMTVQIAPVRYSVDPATQAVSATAFSFTWTIASDESSNCTGSTRTYTGTVAV
ncbi:MAG: hypothetical protein ABIR32_03210 [Ilumatobacteraceae bacterium]